MTTVDVGFASITVRERTIGQRLACNMLLRRFASAPTTNRDENDLRAQRSNFIVLASYSEIEWSNRGMFCLPKTDMSDEEFEEAFASYLTLTESQYLAWNDAVSAVVKVNAPPETLTEKDKRDPN
jgi:hypothetical protein